MGNLSEGGLAMVELLQYLTSMGLPPSMLVIIGLFLRHNNRLIRLETKVL